MIVKSIVEYISPNFLQATDVYCGVDEVSTTCLAGPMNAAVVVLPKDHHIAFIADSKTLSDSKIQELADQIANVALYYHVFEIDTQQVDELGEKKAVEILWKACALAVRKHRFDIPIIIDGNKEIPGIRNQQAIVKADVTHANVSAAAILSKAISNQFFYEMDKLYPEYHFRTNKGYAKGAHIPSIKEYGLCPIHRPSFVKRALDCYQEHGKTVLSLSEVKEVLHHIKVLFQQYPELKEERYADFLQHMDRLIQKGHTPTIGKQDFLYQIYKKLQKKQKDYAKIGYITN